MVRDPAVAGQFYPGSKASLLKEVGSLFGEAKGPAEDALGVVAPHAGYMYSGQVAGMVFRSIKPKPNYIILGPNHTGLGGPFSLDANTSWQTPLGEVGINQDLAADIKKNCPYIKVDGLSHIQEHSIEVQLPFLQFMQTAFKFVPVTISYSDLSVYRAIGTAIAKSIKDLGLEKDTCIIASSDMTHYESREAAKVKDSAAIEAMLALDEDKLIRRVSEMDITMCGYAPAVIMMTAVKTLGAKKARLVKYQTSGDVSGDYSSVVGYAGIIIT